MAKLYFHYSSMNAGKSTLLLQVAHNYEEQKMRPLLIKPTIDDREGGAVIASRIGISKACQLFESGDNLFTLVEDQLKKHPVHAVLLDEAQFIQKEQVWQLAQVVDELAIPVLCYGLRTDFLGDLFPGSKSLMAIADVLQEIRTVDKTGKKATMVLRIDKQGKVLQEGPQNFVGGDAHYKSVSRKEWRKAMNK